jgi:TP901 family phage tail tape measure protein
LSEDLKIKIIGNLDTKKTTEEIQAQLNTIEKKLNVQIGVDAKVIDNISKQVNQLQKDIQKQSKSVNIINDKDSIKNIDKTSSGVKELYSDIDKAVKHYSKLGQVKIDQKLNPVTKEMESFTLAVTKANGIVERLKFGLANIQTPNGLQSVFERTDVKVTDNTQSIREKALQDEQKLSGIIDNQNDKLSHRLEIYKQQAALNAKKLQRNYDSSDIDTRSLQSYLSQVNRLNATTPDLRKKMDSLDMSFKNIKESVSAAGSHTLSFSDQLSIAMERTILWTAATTALFGSLNLLNMWIDQVILLDDKLISIKKVADGDIDMTNVLQGNIDAAEEFGRRLDGALDSYEKIIALGYSAQDAMKLNENSMLMATVGENLTDQQSAEYLTAIMKQYEMSVEQTSKIVDSFNNLSNKTGATVESLAASLSKSSAAANVAGIDFDELASISASLQETLKISGQESGNFLKTLSTRLLRTDTLTMLESLKVQVRDANGELLSGTKILENLSNVYGNFDKTTQNDISQALGGVYHINKVNTVLTQMDNILKYTTYSMDSFNSAQNELATFQEGLSYKINNLVLSFQELAMEASTAGGRDGLVTIIESAENLVSGFTKLIDATDGWVISLSPALGTLTAMFLALNGTARKSILQQGLLSTSLVRTGDAMSITTGKSRILQQQMYNMTLATRAASGAFATLGKVGKSSLAFMGSAFLPIAGMMLLGEAISFLMGKYQEAKKAEEEMQKEQELIVDSYGKQKEKVDSLIESHLRYSSIKNKTKEEEQEHLEIQEQLGTMMPSLISKVDDMGKMHIKVGDALQEEIKYAKELIEIQKQRIADDYAKKFDKSIDKRKKALDEIKKLQDDLDNPEGYYSHKEGYSIGSMSTEETKKAQLNLRAYQREVANTNLLIRDQVEQMITEILKLNNVEINDTLATQIKETVEAMDVKDLDADELAGKAQDLSNAIADYQKKLSDGSSGQAVQQSVNDMKALAKSLGFTDEEAEKFIDTLIKQASAHDKAGESAEEQAKANEQLLKSYEDAVDNISELNGVINELNDEDGYGLSADSMGLLIEKYPDLLGYINDESALREQITKKIQEEENVALDAMTAKLDGNEQYFNAVKKGNEALINSLAKTYKIDLENVKNVSQLKFQINKGLISQLGDTWSKYYDVQTKAFTTMGKESLKHMTAQAAMNSPEMRAIGDYQVAMRGLSESLRNVTSEFTGGRIAFEGLDSATKKSSKEYEHATYISDKFKKALDNVNLALEKQQKIQQEYPKHSKHYQYALKNEMALLQQKKKLLDGQTKSLQAQIKAGKIAQTGIITSKSVSASGSSSPYSGSLINRPITQQSNVTASQLNSWINSKVGRSSLMYNSGSAFMQAASASGLDPLYLVAHAAHETGWGKSRIAKSKNNFYGIGAFDSSPYASAYGYNGATAGIVEGAKWISKNYANGRYGQDTLAKMRFNNGVHQYATDPRWADKIASIMSGSGLTGSSVTTLSASSSSTNISKDNADRLQGLDQAKSEILNLQTDALGIQQQIQALQLEIAKAPLYAKENRFNQIDSQAKIYDARMEKQDPLSKQYRTGLQNQLLLLKEKKKLQQESMVYLERELKTNKFLTESQRSELQATYLELRNQLVDIDNSIVSTSKEFLNSSLDALNARFDKTYNNISKKISDIDHQMRMLSESDTESLELSKQKLVLLQKQKDEAANNIKLLKSQTKNLKWHSEELQKNNEKIEYWHGIVQDIDESMKSINDQTTQHYDDVASKVIEAEKDYYREKQKLADEHYNKEKQRLSDLHEEEMDNIRSAYEEKMKSIDDQFEAETYDRDLRKKQEETQKIQEKINKLMLDDSIESTAKIADLQEELANKKEEIADFVKNREIDLRKESLQEQQKLDEQRVQDKYDEVTEALEKEKEATDKYYDNLINNERYWASIREDVMNGNIKSLTTKLNTFSLEVQKNMGSLGSSIQNNLIDKLREAIMLMSTVSNTPAPNSDASTGQPSALQGKVKVTKAINLWKRNGDSLEMVRILKPGEEYKVYGYDEKYGGQYNVGAGYYITNMPDHVKYQQFESGGFTGNWAGSEGKFAMLHQKELVLNKNQTSDILQSVKVLDKFKHLLPKLNIPKFNNNTNNGSIHFDKLIHIDNIEKDANINIDSLLDTAMDKFITRMKPYGFIK